MKYNENMLDFAEFDKILFETDMFENPIQLGKTVDNAIRKPMSNVKFNKLQNSVNK